MRGRSCKNCVKRKECWWVPKKLREECARDGEWEGEESWEEIVERIGREVREMGE